tara:strand:+ start:1841 stop:4090 length:2250 start_codon:yes stop_codon:yes gene_type:complete
MLIISNFKRLFIFLLFLLIISSSYADVINKIEISGNSRVSDESIKMFSNIKEKQNISTDDINRVLKNLYDTNFFKTVNVKVENEILKIFVEENPIIQSIFYEGIKAEKIKDAIVVNNKLKEKSSFNEIILNKDREIILENLKKLGYYFASVDINIQNLDDNKLNIIYDIDIGEKAKIGKISFIGDKVFKDKKLSNIILSEEYKFWKFISGKKYLNQELINFDKRLLRNYYLNKGYYNVKINSSFAKLIDINEFELIFNIDAGKKIYFGDISLGLPVEFDKENYSQLFEFFEKLKDEPYSLFQVEKILEKIEVITINEQNETVKSKFQETIVDNKINLNFKIDETEKIFVEKINIYGNNITRESVIRNQFLVDEGDQFNEILFSKTISKLKSLNFFKSVKSEIIDGKEDGFNIINLSVEEKATGEIMAGAGTGTSGGSLTAGVKENNYLGKGIKVDSGFTITEETLKGNFFVKNPNYNNTDKSLYFNAQAIEVDRLSTTGYKSNKQGLSIGTEFEYLDDLSLGMSFDNFYERISVDSNASARQKAQKGNYWDTFVELDFFYDKRNYVYDPTDGFFSQYSVGLPLISETNTLTNTYNYKVFTELYENNVTSASFLLKTANSITGDDVKLSERLYIPAAKLRGFESGKVGPKDGSDYIGGNYVSSINLTTTVPQVFEQLQTVDIGLFFDAANVWGVDYDSSISDNSKIRSSIGVGLDWKSAIGPMSFSLAQPLTKDTNDVEENFRFKIGTSF